MRDSLRNKLEELLEKSMDDGLNTDNPGERKDVLKATGAILVQLAKIDAKMPDDDDDETNFEAWSQKMTQTEKVKN